MIILRVVALSILITGCSTEQQKFPPWFMFGAGSSAYQVEGSWNVSDKGESIWDRLLHEHPEVVLDRSNGDVACDSYRLWKRDIEMCEELGLNMYRFSISWTRLLPSGFPTHISEDGRNFYNNLINTLLEKKIEPMVTIYHSDLPQSLQDLGGWANPLIADWYADYANVVFSLFADRVKYWITINEPIVVCDAGYMGLTAPNFNDSYVGRYLCNKNVLMAHAKAYRLYEEFYKTQYNGKLSIANLFFWFEPVTPEDEAVTNLTIQYWEGRYAHPIFSKEGGWPVQLENFLNNKAKSEGYHYPRLPPFTTEEKNLVRGTYDFYGLNHYSTRLVRNVKPGEPPGAWFLYGSEELNIVMQAHPTWTTSTAADWFSVYPQGLGHQLQWLNTTYDLNEIIITGNGIPLADDGLVDTERLGYYRDNLDQILLAIESGINVTGFTAWTLMDNFEWFIGYKSKFGLYAVDFSDPNRKRTPRESARYYSSVTRSRLVHPMAGFNMFNYV